MRTARQNLRRLPIRNDNHYSKRDEFRTCLTKECQNIIATWAVMKTGRTYCASCSRSITR